MMHSRRCWCLQSVDSAEVLAKMLTETTGCGLCAAPDYAAFLSLSQLGSS
jgi:hypothetical protein